MPLQKIRPNRREIAPTDPADDISAAIGHSREIVVQLLSDAASAEQLNAINIAKLMAEMAPEHLRGIVAHMSALDHDCTLAELRASWPAVLGQLDDSTLSAIARFAVMLAGGEIVDRSGKSAKFDPIPIESQNQRTIVAEPAILPAGMQS